MQTKHFLIMAALLFAGVISFFQVGYNHDSLAISIGVAFVLAATGVFIYKAMLGK